MRPKDKPKQKGWREALREIGPAVYICVGTDRQTGDSLGPLVGTMLMEAGVPHVLGCLSSPIHAGNIGQAMPDTQRLSRETGLPVIGIDAVLGSFESVGEVKLYHLPLRPGAALGKELPPVGDYTLAGVVNVGGFMPSIVIANTRLSLVYNMAQEITREIVAIHRAAQEVAASKEAAR